MESHQVQELYYGIFLKRLLILSWLIVAFYNIGGKVYFSSFNFYFGIFVEVSRRRVLGKVSARRFTLSFCLVFL